MKPLKAFALISSTFLLSYPVLAADTASKPYQPIQLTDIGKGQWPTISSSANKIYVAYLNGSNIYCSTSSDSGKSWTEAVKVCGNCVSLSHPVIAAGDDGSVNVAFAGKLAGAKVHGIYFTRSNDGGKTFSAPVDISDTSTESSEPRVSLGPDNSVHIVWIDALPAPNGPDVFYTVSRDGGKSWSKREDISNTPRGISTHPYVSTPSDGKVHVVWSDSSGGEEKPDIWYMCKTEKKWSAPQNISLDEGLSLRPCVAGSPMGGVCIIWIDTSKKVVGDVLCAIKRPNKKDFEKARNLSNTTGISGQPALTTDRAGRLASAWIDTSSNKSIPDIWANLGAYGDFSRRVHLYHSKVESTHPSLTISQSKVFTVWQEASGEAARIRGSWLQLE